MQFFSFKARARFFWSSSEPIQDLMTTLRIFRLLFNVEVKSYEVSPKKIKEFETFVTNINTSYNCSFKSRLSRCRPEERGLEEVVLWQDVSKCGSPRGELQSLDRRRQGVGVRRLPSNLRPSCSSEHFYLYNLETFMIFCRFDPRIMK